MKNLLFIAFLFVIVLACKETKKNEQIPSETRMDKTKEVVQHYPEEIGAILEAHGGKIRWSEMEGMSYELRSRTGVERHMVSLKDRRCKIESDNWIIGYDGEVVWLKEHQENAYKGNARFYHNLMFYFYAMPFVLADDGIEYTILDPATLDGNIYNAIQISYKDGVGDSPKDEYILYFDPLTNKMTWLAYTVTFKDNEKSDNWKFIKYDTWQEVNGLELPSKLVWYTVVEGLPTTPRKEMEFSDATLTNAPFAGSLFDMPIDAKIAER